MKLVSAVASCTLLLIACNSSTAQKTAIVVAPRGTIVFVREHNNDESLFIIRADGTGEKLLRTTPKGPATLSHRGDRIAVAAFDSSQTNLITTATIKTDGSDYKVLALTSPGLNLGPGVWSADDSRIAFEGWDDVDPSRNGIYAADAVDGGNLRRLSTNAERMDEIPISYSPDGSKILFWKGPFEEQPGKLFLVGAAGGDPVQVSPAGMTVKINDHVPGDWSPDGAHISFAAFSTTISRSGIFVAAGDGTNPKRVSDWGTGTTTARWSPNGDWILFDKNNDSSGRHSLFLIRPDGSGTKVVGSLVGICCAVWSPDGNRLLFRRGPTDSESDLWTLLLDGSHLTQLTHSPATLNDIGWSAKPT